MSGSISGNPRFIADRSGTIAAGGTAQVLMAANSQRMGYWIQNVGSGDLWISAAGTASAGQPSLRLSSGSLYESVSDAVPTSAISIFGATTGQAFSAREF
jgi:hypothetical protein